MSLSIKKSGQSVEFIGTSGQLCGSYHYEDMFKSFFRGLYTPGGKDVLACPPPEHLHHKGLLFGLCTSAANFWEEDEFNEPDNNQLPIGKQQTTTLELLSGDGIGFTQTVLWETDTEGIFNETRKISVREEPGSYVWTWQTTLIALRDVQISKSVWGVPPYCSQQFGYCGLGLRLASDLFQDGEVLPADTKCGSRPAWVSFRGKGVEVKFEQDAAQANALFVSTYQAGPPYAGGPGFAYMCLVPPPRDLQQGAGLEGNYVITVSDV
jgi:hypothetical protein